MGHRRRLLPVHPRWWRASARHQNHQQRPSPKYWTGKVTGHAPWIHQQINDTHEKKQKDRHLPHQTLSGSRARGSSDVPNFGRADDQQPVTKAAPPPFVPAKFPSAVERQPSPHNKQPRSPPRKESSPTSRIITQACGSQDTVQIKPMPKKAPPSVPADDDDEPPSATPAKPPPKHLMAVSQAIASGRKAPPAFPTHTVHQQPPSQAHQSVQQDYDPWNDMDDHIAADTVIEVLTPAAAMARAPSPARPATNAPHLGDNPRLAAPHLLPQAGAASYTPWQESFSPPTPQPPAPFPTLQPMPAAQNTSNIQAVAAPVQQMPAQTVQQVPRPVQSQCPPQFMGNYQDGRPSASSLIPIRQLIPTSVDGGAAPPNPMPPAAWGFNGNNLPFRVANIHHQVPQLTPIPPREVAQLPSGNYPYLAFSEDAPWQIDTTLIIAMESALEGSRMSIFGLILDAPNGYRQGQTLRVLWMPLPSPGTDVITLVTQGYIWSLMMGAIAAAGHQNAENCYSVVHDFMTFAVYIRRFPQGHPAVDTWVTIVSEAILDCSCYMLPMAWRRRFAQEWGNHVFAQGQPERLHWRRGS